MLPRPDPVAAFYEKTQRHENGCLVWTGALDGAFGYGRVVISGTRSTANAHRWIYEQTNGPIPPGLVVRHKCDNPPCVDLDHLELGTYADNAHDRDSRGRHAGTKKTHCKHGHEFTPENTYVNKNGHRLCRACGREVAQRIRNANKEN